LFDPVFDRLAALLPSAQAPVVAALDDTLCNRTGRHIPGATYARDPLPPPFHVAQGRRRHAPAVGGYQTARLPFAQGDPSCSTASPLF